MSIWIRLSQENVKAAIEDLMENHREQLTKLADVAPTFQGLITKYEQNTESGGDRDGVATERCDHDSTSMPDVQVCRGLWVVY